MDPTLLRVYQIQVAFQCRCVLIAATTLDELEIPMRAGAPFLGYNIFCNLQNLLTAAANLQKVFWGQGGRAAHRKPLRDSLNVSDDSPLHNVDMRNHFEHMDERIDAWWRDSRPHGCVDLNIGPPTFLKSQLPPESLFRSYDPDTGDVFFWGTQTNIKALVCEAERILPLAIRESERRLPLPPSSSTPPA
jgi:hypothetical protein